MTARYKPFLLISTRPEDNACAAELVSFREKMGLIDDEIIQVRLEQAPLGDFDIEDYSGIVLGGSPFNSSDAVKTELQQRVEADIARIMTDVLERDFPLFGACYGIGAVGTSIGAVVDPTYGETASVVDISLTDEGKVDPVLEGMPPVWQSMVGHKDAITSLPGHAVLLASGESCPVQMFRVGSNVYATQFHPELDPEAFAYRLRVYEGRGYYGPGELDGIIATTVNVDLSVDDLLLRNFARIHRRPLETGFGE